jgi:hypothetical protein
MYKRTVFGSEEYAKWKAFRQWLTDYRVTRNYSVDSIKIWEDHLIYGMALGVSKKSLSELSTNYKLSEFTNSSLSQLILSPGIDGKYDPGLIISELIDLAVIITGSDRKNSEEEKDILNSNSKP